MDFLSLSYLNQLLYCERRFWLMCVEGEFAVNGAVLEGTLQHEAVHTSGESRRGEVVTHRQVYVWSERLRLAGLADVVEESTSPLPLSDIREGKSPSPLPFYDIGEGEIPSPLPLSQGEKGKSTSPLPLSDIREGKSPSPLPFYDIGEGEIPSPLPLSQGEKGKSTSPLPLSDIREGKRWQPVEYKHGKMGKWVNDQVQLCAQAMCLEERTGVTIPQGQIFYQGNRRRETVLFTAELRTKTEATVARAFELLEAERIPAPIDHKAKCRDCSLQPICLPEEIRQLGIRN